jgi:hypothetical protein
MITITAYFLNDEQKVILRKEIVNEFQRRKAATFLKICLEMIKKYHFFGGVDVTLNDQKIFCYIQNNLLHFL